MVAWFRKRIPVAAVLSLLMGVAIPGQAPGGEASKDAQSVPVLRVLQECPATEPTCVVFDIGLVWEGKRFFEADRHPSVVSVEIDDATGYGTAVVEIRGRLNGGPEKKFRVVLPYPMDQLNCVDFSAAVIGVSDETVGTVLTDAGRLEIIDESLSFGDTSSLKLIGNQTLAVTRHLSSGWEIHFWNGELVVRADGRVVWRVRDQCLDFESGKMFQVVPEGECRGNELVNATNAEIKRVREGNVFKDAYVRGFSLSWQWDLEPTDEV